MKEELLKYKKKLIAYSIATGIGITSLTGCAKNDLNDGGTINYEAMMNTHFLNITYVDKKSTYIVDPIFITKNSVFRVCDILTGKIIKFNIKNLSKSSIISYQYEADLDMQQYLEQTDNIKNEYTKEEVKRIINNYVTSQNYSIKKLVK